MLAKRKTLVGTLLRGYQCDMSSVQTLLLIGLLSVAIAELAIAGFSMFKQRQNTAMTAGFVGGIALAAAMVTMVFTS